MTYSFETYVMLDEENEIEVLVEYNATYRPAKLSGPWEDCYPEESEMEITKVHPLEDIDPLYESQFNNEVDNAMERFEAEAWEDYAARQEDL